jgi:hypothetical protein
MTSAIVDTSALINLGHFAHSMPKDERVNNMVRVVGGVEFAIEAMVIYDTIYVDGHSFEHHRWLIDPLDEEWDFIAVLPVTAAQRVAIQKAVSQSQLSRLANEPTFPREAKELLDSHLGGSAYLSYNSFCASQQYFGSDERTIRQAIGDDDFEVLKAAKIIDRTDPPTFIVLVQMLRALFYLELQRAFHCNLVLHPFKGIFVAPDQGIPRTIIDVFDKEVRVSRAKLAHRWFGGTHTSFRIPLLTSYVFSHMEHGLMAAIKLVRESKQAVRFRKGVSELVDAINADNTRAIDEALANLV